MTKTRNGRVLNLKRDPLHHMLPLHPAHLAPNPSLPASTNNRAHTTPVRDQKNLGSCTAFSTTGNLEHTLLREEKDPGEPSEMLQYQLELMAQRQFGQDVGSTVSMGMRIFLTEGYGLARECPYVVANFRKRPSPQLIKAAAARKLVGKDIVRVVQDLAGIKTILAAGSVISFGADLPQSFEDVGADGIWNGPAPANDPVIGGHAIQAIDYDDAAFNGEGGIWVKNSWGTEYGLEGYVCVPYAWFLSSHVSDMAAIVAA